MEPTLHRLNTSFQWQPAAEPSRRLTAEHREQWNDIGAFVLEDAIDPSDIADVAAAIDPFEQEMTDLLKTQPGGKVFIADAAAITFTTHMVTKSAVARRFATMPVFGELAADLVGPEVRFYWDQAVYKKPESHKEFPWHQDNGYNFIEPQQYLTCWVPLTDATVDNGCPWVVPGLHRRGTLQHWWTDVGWQCIEEPVGAQPVEVKAGSIVVFSSLTPHRTGPNLTTKVRKAYIIQFAPEGAQSLREDGDQIVRQSHDDPDRQFVVVRAGAVLADP